MWIQADYKQINEEVKERNRFQKALYEIKNIAIHNYNQNISTEMKEQFNAIVQKCDNALKS
jgi:molecular chaperone DnaK (HSP70)